MIKLSESQIKDIAEELEIGMKCFIHKETGEMISYPDELKGFMIDEELWEEQIGRVEKDGDSYIEIEGMDSQSSFRLMEDFIDTVEDKNLSARLDYALSRPKPFQNFKYEIDYSGEYRQKWFDYKSQRTIEWVREQLNLFDE